MVRIRVNTSISFKNEMQKKAAIKKSQQRGRTLSAQIQKYFDNLPYLNNEHEE